ncbi:MAG TPA: DUF481 domain-containing protein [Acidobacteriota bacterium]|nr:DUF481 domain-containing protein [Acidobacteriota bacterium]
MGNALRLILIAVVTIGFASVVFAHDPEELPPRMCHGTAEFSFVNTSGNTDTQTLGLGGSVECKPGLWTYLAKGAFIRSESDDVLNAKTIDALFRASRKLTDRLEAYGQFSYFQNEFAGIENRYSLEGGVLYSLITNDQHSLQVNGGIGYTNEDRVPIPGIIDEDLSFASLGLGASYRWKISKTAEFGEDATFTINLNDGDDWRFANTTFVAASINTIFSLKLSYLLTYLNQPVPGFGTTDSTTSAALVAKF